MKKTDELLHLIQDCDPFVIFITETWLSKCIPDAHLCLAGYSIYRKDRDNGETPYGGVLVAIKTSLNPSSVNISTNLETVFCYITVNSVKMKLGLVYRPPSSSQESDASLFELLKEQFALEMNFCLLGDFNFPNIDWQSYYSGNSNEMQFIDVVNELNMTQNVHLPTRENNILDLCLTSHNHLVKNLSVHETFSTSDHSYITFDLYFEKPEPPPFSISFNFKTADWELLRAHLGTIVWSSIFQNAEDDPETMWLRFKQIIYDLTCAYVPIFIPKNKISAPWINRKIKRLSQVKKRKWRQFLKHNRQTDLRGYRNFCKTLKREVESSRSNYEKRLFNVKKQNPKNFFLYIDTRTNSRSGVSPLNVNDDLITDDGEKASALSQQYRSVFVIDDGYFPAVANSMPPYSFDETNLQISDRDIIRAILSMNSDSAPGIDGIYAKVIKNVSPLLVSPLKQIFQATIYRSCIPNDWKIGIITPVYKNNGKPELPASYRPISLTSIICKLLERIISDRFTAYLRSNSLISQQQHGFLSKRSTMTNMLNFFNDLTSYFDEKYGADVIYIDLEKAFDKVSHPKLLFKLQTLGVGGKALDWFCEFLYGRKQCVRVNEVCSPLENVLSGIPQGTILGPLLFIIFIDDIISACQHSKINLYADDSKIYKCIVTEEDAAELQEDFTNVLGYFEEWQLSVNESKTELLHVGHWNQQATYHANGNELTSVQGCRDLGFYITDDLSFHKHISNIVRSSSYRLKQFRLSFESRDRDFLVFLYSTYIRPILESGTVLWSPHYLGQIDRIENVQRQFTKYLPGLYHTSYLERLNVLALDSLEARRIYFDLIMVYKILYGLVDMNRNDYFTFASSRTRGHSMKLCVNYSRINCRKYFFSNRVINIWNSLPENIVTSVSLFVFKKKIYAHDIACFCRGRAYTVQN